MHNKLLEIIEKKEQDLLEEKKKVSLDALKEKVATSFSVKGTFIKSILEAQGIGVIGEIKLKSPSEKKDFGDKANIETRAFVYQQAGVDAISIITEPHFFKGDLSFVSQVKKQVSLPVLQKDFVVDEYQIYQAKEIGSDALLLIARIIDEIKLKKFVLLCQELGIEPVVEIHSEDDLQKATNTATKIIAVNARDLDTLLIDLSHAYHLLQQVPDKFIKLGFSGILDKEDAVGYKNIGVNGVLIGTALMKAGRADDIINFVKEIKKI